ncbi:MAG TPA: 1-acyl-sn-glycerol-3-phosphate acyltransferase [Bacteroidales bacterium]
MDSPQTNDKFIDIEEVIRKKNPKLLKVFPKFIIKFLKRIIYQDQINTVIENNKSVSGLDFVSGILKDFGTKVEVYGTENIPASGRFIFASNHPLGGLDGIVLMNEVGRKFLNLKFIVNDLLLNVKNLEPLFIPVNKHGRQFVDYARKIEDAYQSDTQILYFPAGLCSRKIKGQIIDLVWHKSFIVKSVQYQRDIIPVYFEGRNTNFFYNLANLRKFLHIKANIEMVFLVGEMFKQQKKLIKLTFGKPIPYTVFDNSRHPGDWAVFVRERVYSMKGNYNLL